MTTLEQRRKKYGIPKIPFLPKGKVVLVFRMPNEVVTAGGLVIPQVWTVKVGGDDYTPPIEQSEAKEPEQRGIIVAAGLAALDEMHDHLIEIGDEVFFGRFAGWTREVERDPEGNGRHIMEMKIEDILGSVDAVERVKDYDTQLVVVDEKTGDEQHQYVKKTSRRKAAA